MKTARTLGAIVAVTVVIILLMWGVHVLIRDPLPPPEVSIVATPAAEVEDAPKVPVQVTAPIKVYQGGGKIKRQLQLPAPVAADPVQEVIAATTVRADTRPHTVTTVINTQTGESETYVRRDPLPWLAWDTSGDIGAYIGVKNGQQAVRLQLRQGVVQVKALHLGLIGSVDQSMGGTATMGSTDYFVGAGVWASW